MKLKEAIEYHISPILEKNQYELLEIHHQKNLKHKVSIKIVIDRLDKKPVTIDDCSKVSKLCKKAFEELLDDYFLEVSSPGLERPLIKKEHYKRFLGSEIKVFLTEPINGEKIMKGKLIEVNDDKISLSIDAKVEIDYNHIQKANLIKNICLQK